MLSLNPGWGISGGQAAQNPSQAVTTDIQKVNADITSSNTTALSQDSMQLALDAAAAGSGYSSVAADGQNIARSLQYNTYNGPAAQNRLNIDYSAAQGQSSPSAGPDANPNTHLSLEPGWGISGSSGNAANVARDLNTVLNSLGSGNTSNLQQNAMQLALDAAAGSNSSLAADAQNIARSLSSSSQDGGNTFSYQQSYSTLVNDQKNL